MNLAGRVAVITGGASGIGAATARRFVAEGASVLLADIDLPRATRLVGELGETAAAIACDVADESQVEAAIHHALDRFGRLDCLFNNAGFSDFSGRIAQTDLAEFDRTFAVLLRGVVAGMKHAAPVMVEQGSGSIINTASVAGLRAGLGTHLYSTAKAAVIHLTTSVAMELGRKGVRVNCICPGVIATPLLGKARGLDADAAEAAIPESRTVLAALQPVPRAGLPEDIAAAAAWLASDDASFVNGHALVVDGGLTGGEPWGRFGRALFPSR